MESLEVLQNVERTMSAGKVDGGISREPLVSHGLNQAIAVSKFAHHEDSGTSPQSPYKNKGKAGDLAL